MRATPTRGSTNVAVLRGELSAPPRQHHLASGERLVTLELAARRDDGPTDTVPVVWHDAPDPLPGWEAGMDLLVLGRVRRRFFRTGGATASRTEVLATAVLPGSRRAAVRKAVAAALAAIGAAGDP